MPGPFHFAWVAAGTAFDANAHAVEDDDIFAVEIEHTEGDFPTMALTVRNPRIGLLAPGRKQWAWLSYDHPTLGITPLFYGRIVGVPDNLQNEEVRLNFVARPSDFVSQKLALAEALKVAPYWDSIWFSPETVNDPDNALESRPQLWHIDRVTHDVSASHIINGEDGTIELGSDDVFYDSLRVAYSGAPARRVEVEASVSWDQIAKGNIDVTPAILKGQQALRVYIGDGLVSDWPKAGTDLGGGWSVAAGAAVPVNFGMGLLDFFEQGNVATLTGGASLANGMPFERFDSFGGGVFFPIWVIAPTLILRYDVSRQRRELIRFALEADTQEVFTDEDDAQAISLTFNSSEITQPVDEYGAIPIGDQKARAYFPSDRGRYSIEYLIAAARSHLLAGTRCVEVSFEISFDAAVAAGLSCRKNVYLEDARLPGGNATGKIIKYNLNANGADGTIAAAITISSTPGLGGTVTAVEGDPVYVDDDYVELGYQARINETVVPFASDVAYSSIVGQLPNDDGIDFNAFALNKAVVSCVMSGNDPNFPLTGDPTEYQPLGTWSQIAFRTRLVPLGKAMPLYDPAKAVQYMNEHHHARFELTLIPLDTGPFETIYDIELTKLKVPKLIDLEAAS